MMEVNGITMFGLNMKRLLLVFLGCILLTSCASTQFLEKQSEALSEGFYAISDSLDINNPPLAKQYVKSTSPLVKLPKNRIEITSNDKINNQNLNKFDKVATIQYQYNNQVQNELLKQDALKDKEIARCHGMIGYKIEQFFIDLIHWSKWVIPIGGAALVVLCIFNPAILPTLLSIGGIIFGIFAKIGNIFLEIIDNILGLFTSKTTTT